MILLLIILVPLVAGLLCFASNPAARMLGLLAGVVATGLGCYSVIASEAGPLTFSMPWMPQLGASFSLLGDNLSTMLCALSGIVLLAVMLMQWDKEIDRPGNFFGLMLLSVAGINGVFLASDGLLFYFFWELALIPVYFLCSSRGGERRIPVTFKFFVYTFTGSLMMLAGLIFIYLHTASATGSNVNSYALQNMYVAARGLPAETQAWVFLLIFSAFAIKMPIFPFHTWQPDTYETSPTPVTIILSALMVKMGIYGVLRWVIPMLPDAVATYSNVIVTLSVIGIVYASCLALVQTDLKRLVAYSSIAHMGLMSAAAFSMHSADAMHAGLNTSAHGLLVQMFNHGINITGMWLVVQMIEQGYGTRDMRKLGGMATVAPWISIAFVIVAFANIALPLTNGFVGEFMLFNGLFQSASQYSVLFMVLAGTGVILGAVYTLGMVRKVTYGDAVLVHGNPSLTINESWAIALVLALILLLGVYPQPFLNLLSA
jgi:NADH-quinone oxidoreductase subunit M